MKISLLVLSAGKTSGKTIPITLSQFLIGRDPQCNLRPASPMVSKRHCAILVKGDQVLVRDFDSTNGTFINNEQVKGEKPLKHNDLLKIGPLEFKVAIEAVAAVPKTAPTPKPPAVVPKPAASPTPVPAPMPAAAPPQPVAASPQNDDDVAAMLLSLQDDTPSSDSEAKPKEDEVPAGSTVMDVIPTAETKDDAAKAEEPAKPAPKKPEPAKAGNTSQAAKAILEKYTRRTRS